MKIEEYVAKADKLIAIIKDSMVVDFENYTLIVKTLEESKMALINGKR